MARIRKLLPTVLNVVALAFMAASAYEAIRSNAWMSTFYLVVAAMSRGESRFISIANALREE